MSKPPPNAFSFELRKKRGKRIIKSMPEQIDKIRKQLGANNGSMPRL